MDILSKITPAETLLLTKGNSVKLKDLLKYTFMDLLSKNVISIRKTSTKASYKDVELSVHTYVEEGVNFPTYKPKTHEIAFLQMFIASPSISLNIKDFVQLALKAARSNWNYKKQIRNSKNISFYFRESFWSNLFGQIKLTEKGNSIKQRILTYLDRIDERLKHLNESDKQNLLETLLPLGGNVFLLNNFDVKILKEFDKEIFKNSTFYSTHRDNADMFYAFLFFDTFYDFDEFEDTFKTFGENFDSFDATFDSADASADSGCSGCGGCGGCG